MREDGQRTCFILGKTPGLGRILLYDDFEDIFKWKVGLARHRPGVAKSQVKVFNGNYALQFYPGSTPIDGPVQSYASRDFYVVPEGLLQLEILHYRPTPLAAWSIGFGFSRFKNGIRSLATVRWAGGVPYWRYLDDGGNWVKINGSDQILAGGAWHRFYMTLDLVRGEYVNFGSDGMVMSLSGLKYREYAFPPLGAPVGFVLELWIVGGGVSHYYDDALVRSV